MPSELMLLITKVVPPVTAMIFSIALVDFSDNKWETTASFGMLLYAFVWFIQSMKGVC